MTEKDFHSCKSLNTVDNISIQRISRQWLWCFWNDKKGNTAHGIKYCPYCGELLEKKEDSNNENEV